MHFEKGFWGVLVTVICFVTISESVVIDIPGPLNATVGGAVFFQWNSNVKILEVNWGIRDGSSVKRRYIFVDDTEVPVKNPTLDASLKSRIHYNGSLAEGRAWFSISNLNVNDSNKYIAVIREESSTPVPHYVEVIVTESRCAFGPCKNGGTCTDKANGFSCKCSQGWEGDDCTKNLNNCASSPCKNGGTCTDLVNGFNCRCNLGYDGHDCRKNIDECASSPCKNGGTCTDLVNGFSCKCASGWQGQDCGTNINECASKPCKNGGTCTDLINGFNCKCTLGYEGLDCTKEKKSKFSGAVIAGIVIGVIFGAILIAVIVFFVYKKFSNKSREVNRPTDKSQGKAVDQETEMKTSAAKA